LRRRCSASGSGPRIAWLAEALVRLGVGSIDAAVANFVGYLAGMVNMLHPEQGLDL